MSAAVASNVHWLQGRQDFDERVLSSVRAHGAFSWQFGITIVEVHTTSHPDNFVGGTYVVFIDEYGEYLAEVQSAIKMDDHNSVSLWLGPFKCLRQDVTEEDRMTQFGVHLYLRGCRHYIPPQDDEAAASTPSTLPR